ncbi:NAD(P)-dependent oxidoreductase [Oscillospiraceae bacterium MB08-C2-2]|nr:NAD(P)-dependent oxidoreductase [Oscillospiraceae bacterium MB08-C2-2]
MRGAVVTGAGGFVGRALVAELLACGIPVLAVVREGRQAPEHPLLQTVALELSNLHGLPALVRGEWDCFYHLAWEGTAGESRRDIRLQMDNAAHTAEAVHTAAKLGCQVFIGAGSIMEKEALAVSEERGIRPGPGHAYASAKLAAHLFSEAAAVERGIGHIWPILTNAYGEGESSPRFLNTTLRKIAMGEPLVFSKASQNYDFIHVQDAARALRLLGQRGRPFCQYVIGSGQAKPLWEFIQQMLALLAPKASASFGQAPFEGVSLPLQAFDTADLREDTGFIPEISFEQGLCRTMDWILEQNGPLEG